MAGAGQAAGGRIAFWSNRDGNYEIYAMDADGSNQSRLTNNAATDSHPSATLDGRSIAFWSYRDGDGEVYTMNSDGSGLRRLTYSGSFDGYPAYSPDGQMIAFDSYRDGAAEVYLMNADGSGQRRLTYATGGDPAFTADGRQVAFTSSRDGTYDIYVIDIDGTGERKLTSGSNWLNYHAAFSPDGRKMAFVSDRDGNWTDIYSMNVDGTDIRRLTSDRSAKWDPAFSPDSEQIAYGCDRSGSFNVWVMDADGSNQTRLTWVGSDNGEPTWCRAPEPKELPITGILPVQAILEAVNVKEHPWLDGVDLVKGKPTAVLVKVGNIPGYTGTINLDSLAVGFDIQQLVGLRRSVRLKYADGLPVPGFDGCGERIPGVASDIATLHGVPGILFVRDNDEDYFRPAPTLDVTPRFWVRIRRSDQPDQLYTDPAPYEVVETGMLTDIYGVSSILFPLSQADFDTAVSYAKQHVAGTYPLPDHGGFGREVQLLSGFIDVIPWPGFAPEHLAFRLWLKANLNHSDVQRVLGVVPKGWMFGLLGGSGKASVFFGNVALVEAGWDLHFLIAPHELGHTLGLPANTSYSASLRNALRWPTEEYWLSQDDYPELLASDGYWVQQSAQQPGYLVGDSKPAQLNFMNAAYDMWVNKPTYETLFKLLSAPPFVAEDGTQALAASTSDPGGSTEGCWSLALCGEISPDGIAQFKAWAAVPGCTPNHVPAGDGAILALDSSGNVLERTAFPVLPYPLSPTGSAYFALRVGYPNGTAQVSIQMDERELARVNPLSMSLSAALLCIPDVGFVDNPRQRRDALLNKVQALEKMLANHNVNGARNKLTNDILKHVQMWVSDSYVPNPDTLEVELSKQQVIDIINEMILRVANY
jgi:TolB protein